MPVSDIVGIDSPEPSLWFAEAAVNLEIDIRKSEKKARDTAITAYDLTPAEIATGLAVRPSIGRVTTMPGEFLEIKYSDGNAFVRWSEVGAVSFRPS